MSSIVLKFYIADCLYFLSDRFGLFVCQIFICFVYLSVLLFPYLLITPMDSCPCFHNLAWLTIFKLKQTREREKEREKKVKRKNILSFKRYSVLTLVKKTVILERHVT